MSFDCDGKLAPTLLISVAVALGLVLRLAFGLAYWVDKPLTGDEREYLSLARSLSNGQGFRYSPSIDGSPSLGRFSRAPLYPLFLVVAGGQTVGDEEPSSAPTSVKVAQAFLGTGLIAILAAIAWKTAGPSASIIVASVAALYPPLIWICSYVLSEALYATLAWLSVLLLATATECRRPPVSARSLGLVLWAGLTGGLAALTRPTAIVFLALAAGWLLWRRPRLHAVVLMLGATLVIAPWTIRNMREYGRFIPIAAQGGVNFWIGNHRDAIGEGDLNANPDLKDADVAFRRAHPALSQEALEPIYYRDALAYVAAHPVWWTGLLVRKAFYTFVPTGPSYAVHSSRYRLTSVVSYLVLLPFAIGGTLVLLRARPAAGVTLGLVFGSAVLTSLIFFPQERYRIPEIDPTLIVCAAAWVTRKTSRHSIRSIDSPGAMRR